MFLVNFLNRTRTDPMYPLFEILYVFELALLVFAIALGLTLIVPVFRMSYHLNIRLRILFGLFHGIIYPVSRIIVMYHEYFGPECCAEPTYLAICTQIKEEFLGYFTTLTMILAVDRWIATKAWAWYERGGAGTLIFFAVQELILTLLGNFVAALLVFEFISDIQISFYFIVVVPIGACIFVITYRRDRREMARMKKGAVVNRYSIAKTFQFKENLAILEASATPLFSKFTRPLLLVSLPPMFFYPFYAIVPAGIGYDELRYISVEMYDLWLAIACVVIIGTLPVFEPKLRAKLWCRARVEEQRIQAPSSNVEVADAYFKMLSNDLGPKLVRLL